MTTIRFADPIQNQRVMSALQLWQSIDFFARKQGRTSDVLLRLDKNPSGISISIERDGFMRKNWMINAPTSLSVSDGKGQELNSIRFVRSQGSIDYYVHIHDGKKNERLEVAGGTGKVRHERK
jgi:hypothetical protein